MKVLSQKLSRIQKTDRPEMLDQAKQLIIKLQGMNRRWNIEGLNRFLLERQRELFY